MEGYFLFGKVYLNKNEEEPQSPLLDEEAFYLFCKKTLFFNNLTADQLYSNFYQKNKQFPLKYKVYEYFKEKGFIIRSGSNYGLDFAIYRNTPQYCHSEMCAYVVDATHPHINPSLNGSMNWQQLTTLTRVMPDVMKMLLLCYVLPISFNEKQSHFPINSMDETESCIDMSNMSCLELLCVRPVTSLVRRLPAPTEITVGENYNKHKKSSILITPRIDKPKKDKKKTRRDVTVVRGKKGSAENRKHWNTLKASNHLLVDQKTSTLQSDSIPSTIFNAVSSTFTWIRQSVFGPAAATENNTAVDAARGGNQNQKAKKKEKRSRDDETAGASVESDRGKMNSITGSSSVKFKKQRNNNENTNS